jgi:4-amino-4-deoxy-L-arabinose transferase-like glycosyltransferase
MIRKPLFLILLLFFVTRLINLTLLPIYADEANYLDWGWRSFQQPHNLFYSLYDAKQPLLIWIFGISEIFFKDPLFAGRIISVVSGIICLLGIFITTRKLFDQKTAYLASVLYILIPIFLFFDRQALMETSIAAVGIWSFYFLDKYIHESNFKNAIYLGIVLAIGVWIKNNALLFSIPLLTIILLYLKKYPQKAYTTLNHLLFAFIFSIIILSPLLFQPAFWNTFHLNSRYTLGLNELIKFPIQLWLKNLLGVLDISFFFLTPLVLLSSIWGFIKYKKSHLYLILWLLIPLTQIVFTTRTLNFRYPESFLVPFIIFAAAAIPKKIQHFILILLIPLVISAIQLVNPPKYFHILSSMSAYSYINDYITGDLTGYLVNNIVKYIKKLDTSVPISITFAVNSGNFEAALIDYFHNNSHIKTAYLDSMLFSQKLSQYECFSFPGNQLYFIARQEQQGGLNRFFKKVDIISSDYGLDYATVYTLKSDCSLEKTVSLSLLQTP